MSELARNVRAKHLEPVMTPAVRARRFLLQPAALGLFLALLVAVLLGRWFANQATAGFVTQTQGRIAILEASALAESVSSLVSANPDNPAPLQAAMTDWVARSPGDDSVIVLQLSGAKLLASTRGTDLRGELPRRLGREEKWLFDLGKELRAAVDTNRSEGVFRKAQIDIRQPAAGRLRVTLPYVVDGSVVGIVQHEAPLPEVAPPPVSTLWPLLVALPLAVYWLLALVLKLGIGEATRPKRWLAFAVALVVLGASWWFFAQRTMTGLETAATASSQQVAQVYHELRTRVLGAEAAGKVTGAGGKSNPWDVDIFQRPRNLLRADGSIDPQATRAAAAKLQQPLSRALRGNALLGLAILAFFALGAAHKLRETVSEYRYAYLYVTPAMAGMLVLVFFPFAYGITLSFTGQTIFNTNQPLTELFVGLQNYADILGDFSVAKHTAAGWAISYQNFYWTLFITICWTASNVALGVTLGMILALALNTTGLRGKAIYRVLLILPWAIPNYITALIWKALFHQQFGAVNQAIQMFGGKPVAWFDGVFTSFMTGLATNGWLSFPFMMVVILGGLQSISADMYEAATVEGATRSQQFWRITLPLLKPTLVPAVILSVVWTFNMFNVIYLVSGGEPAGANEILITKAYKIAFEEYRYAYSAAYSTVIFLILLVYGVFQTRMTRATEAVNT
jgi:arabinogalactan oligomer / maltooligosaccharide transport system permease protein